MKTLQEALCDALGSAAPLRATWGDVFAKCESPIETAMAGALRTMAIDKRIDLRPARSDALRASLLDDMPPGVLWLMAQRQIGRYRVDFLIVGKSEKTYGILRAIAIECDGRDFHTSDEQVARDASRDADLRALGIEVRRYAGGALKASAEYCALSVLLGFFDIAYRWPSELADEEGEMRDS